MAQAHQVGAVNIDVDYWRYVGIVDTSISPPTVVRVVAFLDPSKAIGANITVLQYTRDEGAGWVRDTFDTQDQWKIVDTIKQELSIGDDQDYKWGVSTLPTDGSAAAAVPMALGVTEADPLAPILEVVSDPEGLVESLVQAGYAAAKAPTDFPAIGDPVEKMDLMAEALLVQALEVDASTRVVAEFVHDSGLAVSLPVPTQVVPTFKRPMGPPGPWTAPVCALIAGPACTWVNSCFSTRTQSWILKRTKSCVSGTTVVYCDQATIGVCSETNRCNTVTLPGRVGAGGVCLPPAPPIPVPATPCGQIGPDVRPASDLSNCTLGAWTPPCACD